MGAHSESVNLRRRGGRYARNAAGRLTLRFRGEDDAAFSRAGKGCAGAHGGVAGKPGQTGAPERCVHGVDAGDDAMGRAELGVRLLPGEVDC